MNKLDPRLRYLFHQSVTNTHNFTASESSRVEADAIEVLVRCRGDSVLDELRKVGMKVRFAIQGTYTIVSGEATQDTLSHLNELDIVDQVEAPRPMVAELDRSCRETRAYFLHQCNPSVQGEGVIVGMIDNGIDYTHPSFRNEDGSSRILYLWDQSVSQDHSGGGNFDPSWANYGRQYTQSELNAALASNTPFNFVPHQDTDGHGTHVAGIAADNGRASNGTYNGIAPEADLIVVALKREQWGIDRETGERMTLGNSVQAFEAFAYIVEKAKGEDRPVVVNFSQGMNGGGHCGETLLETALDAQVQEPNVVVVKSAGNEQQRRIHAGGQIAQGNTVTLELQVESRTSDDAFLELWHDGADQISIAVQPPGGLASNFVSPSDRIDEHIPRLIVFEEAAPNDVSVYFDFDAEETGDTRTTFIFSRGTDTFIQPGTWKLLLYGKSVQVGRYDVWIERASRRNGNSQQIQFTEATIPSPKFTT